YSASLAPLNLGLSGLRNLRDELDADQLRTLLVTLTAFDRGQEPVRNVMGREFAFIDHNVRKMGAWKSTILTVSGNVRTDKRRVEQQLRHNESYTAVRLRLLLADLAVKLYFREHGTYPASLDAITPALP